MILQVRIPEGLQTHFSQLRILKGLRARRWDRGRAWGGASRRKGHSLPQSSWWALHFMLPRWRLWSTGNCAATKKTRNTHSKGISGTVGVIGGLGGRS